MTMCRSPDPDGWLRPAMHRRLAAFARRFVGDAHEAEDVAQETLVRARAGLERLRSRERAEAWLFRICRHAAIDHVRSRRVRRGVWGCMPEERVQAASAPDDELPPSPPGDLDLSRLPAHHRLVMGMHYEKGLSQARICRMTGLSASALRVRLFRARLALAGRERAVKTAARAGR